MVSACRNKGPRYWVFAAVFAFAGVGASGLLDRLPAWLSLKYGAYVLVQDLHGGPARQPQTTLVAIGDQEFYGPELAGRRPVKRDYLARLVDRVSEAGPRLIALDVDFRSPDPADSTAHDYPDYARENEILFKSLCKSQAKTRLVISTAVRNDARMGLVEGPNIYDGNPFCDIPEQPRIATGFLALPTDMRRVPLSLKLGNDRIVDSLALAAAKSLFPRQYPISLDADELPYGRFRNASKFERVTATDVLKGTADKKLDQQVVIIYGDWHILAKNLGSTVVDTFLTPVGPTGGAFVHANLIETLLAADYRSASSETTEHVVDALVAAWLAVAFAFNIGLGRKFIHLLATGLLLFVLAWLFFQVFAIFFDIIPILAAMYLHAILDQIEEWREEAKESVRRKGSRILSLKVSN